MTASSLRSSALRLAMAGIVLTIVASIANYAICNATVDSFMQGWVARNGHAGSTSFTLGIVLSNLIYYPIVIGIALIIALPMVLGFHPEWARHRLQAAALVLVPTLVVGALWWAGPRLFAIYTLPAVGFMAASASILIWMGDGATS